MSAKLSPLPPSARDFDVYRLVNVEEMSLRQAALEEVDYPLDGDCAHESGLEVENDCNLLVAHELEQMEKVSHPLRAKLILARTGLVRTGLVVSSNLTLAFTHDASPPHPKVA